MRIKLHGVRKQAARATLLCACCVAAALSLAVPARGVVVNKGFQTSGAERATPAGEVVVVLNEQFLNSLLDAVTSQPVPPTFPLSRGGSKPSAKCADEITLLPETKGTRTAVRFTGNLITAQVAFRGSYGAPLLGCLRFEGRADAVLNLSFDRERQTFNALISVRDVDLRNVPSVANGGITALVQEAIDKRVNPVEILRAEQLGARLPLNRDGNLRLRAADVRHEVAGKELRIRIAYEIARMQ